MFASIPFLAIVFSYFLEFLSLGALWITKELSGFWIVILAAVFFKWILRLKVKDYTLLAWLVLVVGATAYAIFLRRVPILTAFAFAIPSVHTALWLSIKPKNYQYWRLGLSFLEIILASILAPEAYMFLLIFFMTIGGAITLSLFFLEDRFQKFKPSLLTERLPKNFLSLYFLIAIISFLTSLIIFPILPRSSGASAVATASSYQVGYTENVNFSEWSKFVAGSSNTITIHMYLPSTIRPFKLLRGRVLSRYKEGSWLPSARTLADPEPKSETMARIPVEKEPFGSDTLFLPYGAKIDMNTGARAHLSRSGEWYSPLTGQQKKQYTILLEQKIRLPKDTPNEFNLEAPNTFKNPEWVATEKRIFQRAKTTTDKVSALQNFFKPFSATLDTDLPPGKEPLNYFLFEKHSGHCEQFAAASAMLFRLSGTPSRLVTGFRLSKLPEAGKSLLVRNSEAHVWVEVWSPELQVWLPFDPTPEILAPTDFLGWWSDTYEQLAEFWYVYILNYEFSWKDIGKFLQARMALFTVLALFGGLFVFARKRYRQVDRRLPKNRRTLQRMYRSAIKQKNQSALTEWIAEYEVWRFGKEVPDTKVLRKLRLHLRQLSSKP